jgi:hypothetical protein
MGIVSTAPNGLDDRNKIEYRSTAQGIINEMRPGTESDANFSSHPPRIDTGRINGRAECNAPSERWLICLSQPEALAHPGAQTVCADQEICAVLSCRQAAPHHEGRDPIAVDGDISDGCSEAELDI